ncbi:MAG: short-chain dehydrogenase [Moraxellaceae bacterium]|nr:MAG: short-chain dehydrogenase [Moraxellaceae bacterium]
MLKFGARTAADNVLQDQDLSGKIIVVTGANAGIGFETARSLAAVGAKVIFACRDKQKGLAAVDKAKKAHPQCDVEFQQLDLASFDSIRSFCEKFSYEKVDILIANAGLFSATYKETENNIERTVGVCHFGHFLLTNLLMPKLLAADKPRVVMVSSESHRMPAKINFNRFPLNSKDIIAVATMVAYGQAKLCNILFANELQRRFGEKGLNACSLHPGALITTDLFRNSAFGSVIMKVISPFTKNTNQGASTTVYCAAYASEEEIAGNYFSHCKIAKATDEANNPEVAKKLWEFSEKICNL